MIGLRRKMGVNMVSQDTECVEMDMEPKPIHIPVMGQEVIRFLAPQPNSCIVDFTVGLGGHALSILKHMGPKGRLIAVDRDKESLNMARENLRDFSQQCEFVHDDFRHIEKIFERLSLRQMDGMLLDLGISSYQLEKPERGFSFNSEGPLDMRMDQESFISAFDLVNTLSEREIASILRNFGEERWHNRIAHFLIERRAQKPIASTKDLSETVLKAVPSRFKYQRLHPATRTFQAIRIAVNRELEALEVFLSKFLEYLKVDGRICVIAFHSLEDRIVKKEFRNLAREGRIQLLTKKPLSARNEEILNNPRARSAKLRAAQRLR